MAELLEMKAGGAKLKKDVVPVVVDGVESIVAGLAKIAEFQCETVKMQVEAMDRQAKVVAAAVKDGNVDTVELARLIMEHKTKPQDVHFEVVKDTNGTMIGVTAKHVH